ncbi:3'-5' exonuclease [Cohnella sp. REN36]|uniref:3'-5' exonuclease n=1 Tax=Cohnella sp. REN36 TaxID=2887347 RepID=UPI001D143936|nr:3'-5' exonuclease [Cohnella sp. REN36]MCC3375630.1 exonuclease domain-containing protein [Cohnella sp. REN36]
MQSSYIVYDLEMTVRRKKGQIAEIIEIGAAKVQAVEGVLGIVDTYQAFVKPVVVPQLTADTTSFTGITQDDVNEAGTLAGVVRGFADWIGPGEYYLCAWGPDDQRQLVQECRQHRIPTDWIVNHNNLQKMLSKIFKLEKHQQMGLKPALEMLEIPFSGSHHRALDDALNTAQILVKLFDRLQFKINKLSEETKLETEVVYKTDHFENLPFAGLAGLIPDDRTST